MKNYLNNIKFGCLLGAAGLFLASCGDFLYIEPKTFISGENFWNEKADIDQMVTGTYVKMQEGAFISRCIMWGETRCDNITEGLNATNNQDLYRTLKEDLKSTNSFTSWTPFYSVISQCNTIIARGPEVSENDPTYTYSDMMATRAEMAALRDLCYFYLVRAFKDVPYYTQAIEADSDIPPLPATNGDEVVRKCIEDLDTLARYALKAYPRDNTNRYNSSRNRITQSAIYALLADLCLWDGQYQRCVDYCQKVIDYKMKEYEEDYSRGISQTNGSLAIFKNEEDTWSKGYPLYPCFSSREFGNDYNAIFGTLGSSFESLFELAFTYQGSSQEMENGQVGYFLGSYKDRSNNGKGTLAVAERVISDVYSAAYKVYDHKLDCRYFANFSPSDEQYTGGYIAKYVNREISIEATSANPYYRIASQTVSSYDNANWIFYRLTDVMLMQAEALIQLGDVVTSTDETGKEITELDENLKRAFMLIWTVNRRSIMTNSTTAAHANELKMANYQSKASMLELCLKERNRELMFEGKRWFDLLRQCHREGNSNYIKANVPAKITSGATSSLYLNYESLFWPYNKHELRNNPNLEQKPYYGVDDEEDSHKLNN